ncbi:hypothetical protein EGW08_013457 [Elysia chlorotica]|uniref:Ras GTPase-activating protein n=1 Tax=Elysia chlorotica TaxID=188477 RepID=A0A3S1HG93_ELYCH|nr:hypothetical protein EGW08_013457 [Elysia chlorotica]
MTPTQPVGNANARIRTRDPLRRKPMFYPMVIAPPTRAVTLSETSCEAKNLPAASSGSGGRNTCCAIKIDSEEIFRTSTVEKSRDPFYNAEFQGEIPKKFRYLSVYVYDVSNKSSKVLGKVSLKKEELYKFHQKDHWFPLTQQDGDTEVQGKVQVEVRLGEVLTPSSNTDNTTHRLAVSVCECSDLTVINGSCNPYAVVSLSYGKSRNKEVKRTAVKKKTICPQFDEKFFFHFDKGHNQDKTNYAFDDFMSGELSVSLFHDDSKVSREVLGNMFKGTFLGEVKIPVKDIDVSKPHKAWYCLQAKETHRSNQQPLGSLRLRISYSADYVFPSKYYNGLRELVLESAETKVTLQFLSLLVAHLKPTIGQKCICQFQYNMTLIHALADWEMSNTIDPNTLFRGNSLLTKMVDELMKLMGIPYLRDTLKAFIDQVLPCEIDPSRLKDGEDITTNLTTLYGYVYDCINSIINSGLVCPSVMRDVFSTLKARAMLNYPDNTAVRHHAVTSFIFLRFFTAAILSPAMFDLCSDILDSSVQRTLTLISKSISGIVNCVSSKSNTITPKEEYMIPLFDMFSKSMQVDVRLFLDIISSSSGCHFRGIEAPILLKEGFLIKRAQGRKKFGLKNFKKRFFRLTNQSLSYSKTKGEKYLFEIPINDILVVERLAESSFKMKYMFQVVHAQTALYIQASNCVEEKEWLDILMKICKSNKNRLNFYHPAAFVNGHWLCCKSFEQTTAGCTPVSGGLPLADIQAYVEDELVEKAQGGSQAVYTGPPEDPTPAPAPSPWQADPSANSLEPVDPQDPQISANSLEPVDPQDPQFSANSLEPVDPQDPQDPQFSANSLEPVDPQDPQFSPNSLEPLDPQDPQVSPTQSPTFCQGSPVSVTSSSFNPMIPREGVLLLGSSIEDPGSCYTTLADIQRCVITLEQEHIQYMRSVQRRTVIGSIDTPIGDESCADLVRSIYRSSERLSRHGSRSSNASNLSCRSYRGSRSRGGSFRERERSGGGGGGGRRGRDQGEGVRKSLSGDVSSSGRSLGVEFKSEVKKAASYDVMSCDIGEKGRNGSGGGTSRRNDSAGYENRRAVFTVGRKDTESFSGSSRTESSGGNAPMSTSSGAGPRESTTMVRSSSTKPERSDSNAEQDDVFDTESSTSSVGARMSGEQSLHAAPSGRLSGDNSERLASHTEQAMPRQGAIVQENGSAKHGYPGEGSRVGKSPWENHVNLELEAKTSEHSSFPNASHEESINNQNKTSTSSISQGQAGNTPSSEETRNSVSRDGGNIFTYPTGNCSEPSQHALQNFGKSQERAFGPTSGSTGLTKSDCDNCEEDTTTTCVQESSPNGTSQSKCTATRKKFHIFSRDPSQDEFFNETSSANRRLSIQQQECRMSDIPDMDLASGAEKGAVGSTEKSVRQGSDVDGSGQTLSETYRLSQDKAAVAASSEPEASTNDTSCLRDQKVKAIQNGRSQPFQLALSLSSASSSSTSSPSSPPPPPPQSPLVLLPQPQPKFAAQQGVVLSLAAPVAPSLVLQPPTPHDPRDPTDAEPSSPADLSSVDIQYV